MKTFGTILLVVLLMSPLVAQACPCLAIEADGYEKAKMVFTGEVVSVEDIGSQQQITSFMVRSPDKGPAAEVVTVVSDNRRDTGCSAQFKIGDIYTVYTYEGSYLDVNTFKTVSVPSYTNACSRKQSQ